MLPSNPPGGHTRAQVLLLHRLLTRTRLVSGKGNGTFPLSLSYKCLPSRLEVGLAHCITSLRGAHLWRVNTSQTGHTYREGTLLSWGPTCGVEIFLHKGMLVEYEHIRAGDQERVSRNSENP